MSEQTRDWHTVCRMAARIAAESEACDSWQVGAVEEVPFNYRWEHVQHVVGLARWLAAETGADAEVVEAAAWLHDVRKTAPKHAAAGAQAAQAILAGTDFPPAKIAQVADAITQHEGLIRDDPDTPMQPLEAAVLWDADKLSKIGVQALIYTMITPYMAGRTLAERRRRNVKFVESVLPRTVASMNTAPARRLAETRYQANVAAMEAWAAEESITAE